MIEKMKIWGRTKDIEIVFDVYVGETVEKYQKDAYNAFLENSEELLESSLNELIKYCLANDGGKIGTSIDNIYKYVVPKAVLIGKNKGQAHIVYLLCDYKFNEDDGIAIAFKNEKLVEIGSGNIV